MKNLGATGQLALPLEDSRPIILPPLDARAIRKRTFTIQHRIFVGGARRIVPHRGIGFAGLNGGQSVITECDEKVFLINQDIRAPRLPSDFTGILKIGPNGLPLNWASHSSLVQYEADWEGKSHTRRDRVTKSWRNALHFTEGAGDNEPGFRKPQLGALHAIGAHWTLGSEAATVVMPTGTGKTETMVAAMIGFSCACVLVITPSSAVRDQVAEKFTTLGKLREFNLVGKGALNPVVGVIKRRPRTSADLEVFKRCNVIVSTVSAIAQGTAMNLSSDIAELCSHLFIDEAHHVPAKSWSTLKAAFQGKPVLQFTATPYREDGELVQGRLIYNYPLAAAQREGFFRRINFKGIFEENQETEDEALAMAAIAQLRADLDIGHDHILMARCANKKRAATLLEVYKLHAGDLNPIVIHSEIQRAEARKEELFTRRSRIVICVNMLAEGFDLASLKIAAVHDKHKSLAVLLQFVGRFTRTAPAADKINEATVVANLADPDIAEALRSLFVEDPDWNTLLAEVSFDRMEKERRILDFMRSAKEFALNDPVLRPKIAIGTIRPKQTAIVFEAKQFVPENFISALNDQDELQVAWISGDNNMAVSVHVARERVVWTRNRRVEDEFWELRVAYFHKNSQLLFIHGSDNDNLYTDLAAAVSENTATRLEGNECFRIFGGINRLTLHQAGVKKLGARRGTSYMQASGTDVKPTMETTRLGNSRKAMMSGTGFENGSKVAIGGSRKGKVWARQGGLLPDFIDWCNHVATKIRDASIDPEQVLEDGIQAVEAVSMPVATILRIEWGERLYAAGNATLLIGSKEFNLYECDIEVRGRSKGGTVEFAVVSITGNECRWSYGIDADGFHIKLLSEDDSRIIRGKRSESLTEFFGEDPPSILFVDGSEIMGNELFCPKAFGGEFSAEQLKVVEWRGVDKKKESLWKDGLERPDSVQARAIQLCIDEGFDFIFNDDDAGEVADIVAIKKSHDSFIVRFVHCKFSKKEEEGARVGDVTEVASQASRSVKWTGKFHALSKRLKHRGQKHPGKNTRYVKGGSHILSSYERLAMAVVPKYEVVAAQPGVSKSVVSIDQKTVLGAADAYLRQTVELPLVVWCSP